MEIDLSEFLVGHLPKVAKKAPPKPVFPAQSIICGQCKGSGNRIRREMHTPELSVEAEDKLTELGKVLPIRQEVTEEVKCEKCGGAGHHFLSNDIRNREVTLIWTEVECACGAHFNGPAYVNSCLIRSDEYRPIIHEGRLFGWRYVQSVLQPMRIEAHHRLLPMKIETVRQKIDVCRKCVREQMIICLPHIKEAT